MDTNSKIKLNVRSASVIGVIIILSLILAACASAATPINTQTVATQSSSSASTVTIDVATDPALGKILVDGSGKTLYIFTKDTADTSNCNAACLANWPPFVSSGTPKVGPGVDASLIGLAALANGEKIVTYDHMPLYYYIKDTAAGQTSGQNVGSVWFVVSPDGKPVGIASSSTPTSAPIVSSAEPTINVATDPKLGQYLVDGKGMTLYIFTKDTADTSNCNATCLANWPALLTSGNPVLGAGVDDSKIGFASLADGKLIVTYNHMPLYYYVKDTAAGQTSGQNVGSVWFVVSPDGKPVGDTSSSAPTAAPVGLSAEPTINVATDPKLGQFLVDGKGMTLYIYTKDGPEQL